MRKPFAEVTRRTQVRRLKRLATLALPAWGLTDAAVRLLFHGYNTTFRIEVADGRRYALRLNTAAAKPEPNLLAEVSWLAAVAADTPLRVPTPQRTLDGAWAARVASPDHGRDVAAVLFSWLDGRDLGHRPRPEQAWVVGRAMATLHDHATRWRLPEGAELPLFDRVLTDLPNRFGDHPALVGGAREVVLAAHERAQALQDEAFAAGGIIPLHADLHGGNLKWAAAGRDRGVRRDDGQSGPDDGQSGPDDGESGRTDGESGRGDGESGRTDGESGRGDGSGLARLRVFDFDDAGLGVPALDLAISIFYLRDDVAIEEALKEGYASVRTLPQVRPEVLEGMIAGRNLLLLDDLIEQSNADFRVMVPTYVANTTLRLRNWLDTGRFRRDVPGVQR